MSFAGGKLKLKGGDTLGAKGVTKKKKKKSSSGELALVDSSKGSKDDTKALTEGYVIDEPDSALLDRRTPAERRHDEHLAARERERITKMADKSHRQRVAEFNEYLSNLTEHHDIPKVGPG